MSMGGGIALELAKRGRARSVVALARVLPGPRHAPRYRREIPDVETITLSGCGHVPMWDDTELVTRLIVKQIDRNRYKAMTTDFVS